jgi:hypothetical protein
MAYAKLISEITSVINRKFETISANYNFDLGDEFEYAICDFLNLILPEKYGVCRGFAVTKSDEKAGDDIIVYDKERFHRLRLIDKNSFEKKIEVPIEAVYAYFEAKHKLVCNGSDSNFQKAVEQTEAIKKLERQDRKMLSIDHNIGLGDMFSLDGRPKWPKIANPIFTGIIARQFEDYGNLNSEVLNLNQMINAPDIIIAGDNHIIKPEVIDNEKEHNDSPFYIKENNPLIHYEKQNSAFAIGIIQILYALDNIRLGRMPYSKIIMEAIK